MLLTVTCRETGGSVASSANERAELAQRGELEVIEMGIAEELKKECYNLEYEYDEGEDHTEVWTNERAGKAVRIQWMKIEDALKPKGRGDRR